MLMYAIIPDFKKVSLVKPLDQFFESFTPTINVEVGNKYTIIVVEYTTYDSYTSYKEPYYQVIDLYNKRENAINTARAIHEYVREGENNCKEEILYADGTKVKYLSFTGWGNSYERIFIKSCKIIKEPYGNSDIELKYYDEFPSY